MKAAYTALFGLLTPVLLQAAPIGSNNDSIEKTLTRIERSNEFRELTRAIANGDTSAFSLLPAKGYAHGVADVLKRYQLVVNPRYSFTQCGPDQKALSSRSFGPGCVVSLKLARRGRDGVLEDIGIRAEWVKGIGDKRFVPNNSVWASHITQGDGWLEHSVR